MQDPATVNRRGAARDLPNAKGPDLGADAGRGAKGRDLTDVQKGRRVSDAVRDAAKSRDLNSVGRLQTLAVHATSLVIRGML